MRLAGAAAALGLVASAVLHAIWVFSPWPLSSWADWSRAFGGPGFRVPDTEVTVVAVLFAAAAYTVAARATLVPQIGPSWIYWLGTWVVAALLLGRAVEGWFEKALTLANNATPGAWRHTFRLYLLLYLPLFALFGGLSAYVAVKARRHRGL